MAAVIIASPNSNHPAPRPVSPRRPDLRVIHGGRSSANLAMRRVFLRRRLVVGLGLLIVTAVLWMAVVGALSLVGGTPTESQTSAATAAASPAAAEEYFVRPGDTLWVIARQLHPTGDIRSLVDELADRIGGARLQPGQRIDLHGLSG
jgi:hypothetical protein